MKVARARACVCVCVFLFLIRIDRATRLTSEKTSAFCEKTQHASLLFGETP